MDRCWLHPDMECNEECEAYIKESYWAVHGAGNEAVGGIEHCKLLLYTGWIATSIGSIRRRDDND